MGSSVRHRRGITGGLQDDFIGNRSKVRKPDQLEFSGAHHHGDAVRLNRDGDYEGRRRRSGRTGGTTAGHGAGRESGAVRRAVAATDRTDARRPPAPRRCRAALPLPPEGSRPACFAPTRETCPPPARQPISRLSRRSGTGSKPPFNPGGRRAFQPQRIVAMLLQHLKKYNIARFGSFKPCRSYTKSGTRTIGNSTCTGYCKIVTVH
jgi:hypothetical protein